MLKTKPKITYVPRKRKKSELLNNSINIYLCPPKAGRGLTKINNKMTHSMHPKSKSMNTQVWT